MKLHVILWIALALVAWLMPLIFAPATPYVWTVLAIYVVAVFFRSVFNWYTIDRKKNTLNSFAGVLFLSSMTEQNAEVACVSLLAGACVVFGWFLAQRRYKRQRLLDIQTLRSKLTDGYQWNLSEFPQYAEALHDLSVSLGQWQKAIEKESKQDWPWQVKDGRQLRENLRTRFEKRPGSVTLTAVALLLLLTAATSCATGTDLTAEQKREELTAAAWETRTYTDAQGFDQTVAVR